MDAPNTTSPGRGCSTSYWSKQNTTGILCGQNLTNIAIIGASPETSIIDGGGQAWFAMGKSMWGQGPRLFEVYWAEGVVLANVTFTNSPAWTIHPVFSSNIVADTIRILNPRAVGNTDGFDPDSCSHVELVNSFIDTGDDGISIKSTNWTAPGSKEPVMIPARDIWIHKSKCDAKLISLSYPVHELARCFGMGTIYLCRCASDSLCMLARALIGNILSSDRHDPVSWSPSGTILSRNICVGSATFGGVFDVVVEDCRVGDDEGSSPWAIKYKSHQVGLGKNQPQVTHHLWLLTVADQKLCSFL
jgi:polygalacturonase